MVGRAAAADGYADAVLVRLLPDGRLDRSFGKGGRVRLDRVGHVFGLAEQLDRSVVVLGNLFTMARLLPDGSPDRSFGADGVAVSPLAGKYGFSTALALASDGGILIGGYLYSNDVFSDFALLRYRPDGTPDSSFGEAGGRAHQARPR